MNIMSEFKQKYPSLAEMTDRELAQKIHAEHYSDIPYKEFEEKLGVKPTFKESFRETVSKRASTGEAPQWGVEHPDLYGAYGATIGTAIGTAQTSLGEVWDMAKGITWDLPQALAIGVAKRVNLGLLRRMANNPDEIPLPAIKGHRETLGFDPEDTAARGPDGKLIDAQYVAGLMKEEVIEREKDIMPIGEMAKMIGSEWIKPYTSLGNFVKYAPERPLSILLDVSMVGGLVSKLAKLSKPGELSRIWKILKEKGIKTEEIKAGIDSLSPEEKHRLAANIETSEAGTKASKFEELPIREREAIAKGKATAQAETDIRTVKQAEYQDLFGEKGYTVKERPPVSQAYSQALELQPQKGGGGGYKPSRGIRRLGERGAVEIEGWTTEQAVAFERLKTDSAKILRNSIRTGKDVPGYLKGLGYDATVAQKIADFIQANKHKVMKQAQKTGIGIDEAGAQEDLRLRNIDESGEIDIKPISSVRVKPILDKEYLNWVNKNESLKKVHGGIGEVIKPTVRERIYEFLTGEDEKLFNRFTRLPQHYKEVTLESGRKIKILEGAQRIAQRHGGLKDRVNIMVSELRDKIKPVVQENPDLWEGYLKAWRDKDRVINRPKEILNPGDVHLQDAEGAIAAAEKFWESKGYGVEKLREAAETFWQWSDEKMLRPLVEEGFLTEESYFTIKSQNDTYSRTNILEKMAASPDELPAKTSEYFSVGKSPIQAIKKGSVKLQDTPFSATLGQLPKVQNAIERNRVASAVADDISLADSIYRVAESSEELATFRKQGVKAVQRDSVPKTDYDFFSRFSKNTPGVKETFAAPKALVGAMKNLAPTKTNMVILRKIGDIFRDSATVFYVPFSIRNVPRDIKMAFASSPLYRANPSDIVKFAKDWRVGLWEGLKHEFGNASKIVDDYIMSGGGYGFVGEARTPATTAKSFTRPQGVRAALQVAKTPIDATRKLASAIELAPRIGNYNRGLIEGLSKEAAADIARVVSIDYYAGGTILKQYSAYDPFINARFQSKKVIYDAFRRDPKGTLAKSVMMMTPSIGLYAYNKLKYSDLLDDIPQRTREKYDLLITGVGEDKEGNPAPKFLLMPKGDITEALWNPIEFALDEGMRKDPDATSKLLIQMVSDISPVEFARQGELSGSAVLASALPPIAVGAAEHATGKKFYYDSELIPWKLQGKPAELQTTKDMPKLYSWVGKEFGVSPIIVRNYAQSIFAGYGREGFEPSQMLSSIKSAVIRTQGGQLEQNKIEEIQRIEQGYGYIRAYAQEAVKAKDRKMAIRLMQRWNEKILPKFNDMRNAGFEELTLANQGKLMFTPQKIRNILSYKESTGTYLERKLQ